MGGGGAQPKQTKKQSLHQNRKISIGFFRFFLVLLKKLQLVFFWVLLVFGIGFLRKFEIGNRFLLVFLFVFPVFLVF